MLRYFTKSRYFFDEMNGTGSEKIQLPSIFEDSTISANYAQERHSYSEEFFKFISDYCRETTPDLNLAVDVGCGPGNSTLGFTKYFKQVIGVDISESQIAQAPKDIPNCVFKVGNATNLHFLDNSSVDLFACGEAINLMPKAEVFAEAERILRPGGTLAIGGHGRPYSDDREVEAILKTMYSTLLSHCDVLRELVELYPDLQLPYPGWIRKNGLVFTENLTKDKFIGFCKLTHRFMLSRGHNDTDYVQNIEKQLTKLFEKRGWDSQHQELEMKFDGTILLAHKPQ